MLAFARKNVENAILQVDIGLSHDIWRRYIPSLAIKQVPTKLPQQLLEISLQYKQLKFTYDFIQFSN